MITVDFDKLAIRPGARILDVGCGSGRHCGRAIGFADALVVGVDLCAADLAAARQRLEFHRGYGCHGGGPWLLARADVRHLPFDDGFFDVVICCEVLEHVKDHQAAAAELVRVLAPGGDLVISVPRFWPEWLCWALSPAYRRSPGGHLRIYRRSALLALFRNHGMRARASHFAHGLHSPYWWLKCAVGLDRENDVRVRLYHRLLVWQMVQKPKFLALVEKLFNPLWGKSWVVYLHR